MRADLRDGGWLGTRSDGCERILSAAHAERGGAGTQSQQRHFFLFATVRIVLPTKRHALAIEGEKPMIGDGYAMCVAAEISQYLRWAAKCRLRIHNPVLSIQSPQQFGKLLGIREDRSRSKESPC